MTKPGALGRAGRGASEADVKGAQILNGLGRRVRRHSRGEAEQDPGREARPGRIRGGRVYAAVAGTAGYGERAHLAEVVLDIDDDECAHGANGILRTREA